MPKISQIALYFLNREHLQRAQTDVNFAAIAEEILKFWKDEKIFEKSVTNREGAETFTFTKAPITMELRAFTTWWPAPWKTFSAGTKPAGLPGKTQRRLGYTRPAGRTPGGKTTRYHQRRYRPQNLIEEYNKKCRETVMMYKDQWDDLTVKMGYWVDPEKSVHHLRKRIHRIAVVDLKAVLRQTTLI